MLQDVFPLYGVATEAVASRKVSSARLRVAYCLNDACVSPRFLGSGVQKRVPVERDGKWHYERRRLAAGEGGAGGPP